MTYAEPHHMVVVVVVEVAECARSCIEWVGSLCVGLFRYSRRDRVVVVRVV